MHDKEGGGSDGPVPKRPPTAPPTSLQPTIIGPRLKISKKRLELRQIFLMAIALKLGEMTDSTVRSYAIAP
jgi:hypothetical protein